MRDLVCLYYNTSMTGHSEENTAFKHLQKDVARDENFCQVLYF